jgi:hypothetical protein
MEVAIHRDGNDAFELRARLGRAKEMLKRLPA